MTVADQVADDLARAVDVVGEDDRTRHVRVSRCDCHERGAEAGEGGQTLGGMDRDPPLDVAAERSGGHRARRPAENEHSGIALAGRALDRPEDGAEVKPAEDLHDDADRRPADHRVSVEPSAARPDVGRPERARWSGGGAAIAALAM